MSVTPRLKGVLFDKDGTLFDFDATWGEWCRRFLHDLTAGQEGLTGILADSIGYHVETETFLPHSPVIADTPEMIADCLLPHLEDWDHPRLLTHINKVAGEVPQVPIVALAPLLSGLRERGLTLGVATNDYLAPARAHLEAAGVLGLFDFVSGADSGFGGKPQPGPLLAFAGAANLAPGAVAMVGDSAHDMVAGRAAGMICVGVSRCASDLPRLTSLADVVLGDIGELPAWIDSLA